MLQRAMADNDVERVAKLDTLIAASFWTPGMFQEEINLGSYCQILEKKSGSLVGYLAARLQLDEWHLLTLGVEPMFRRQGWARQLIQGLIHKAQTEKSRSVMLEVRPSNTAAVKLYQDIGFNFLYIRRGYYKRNAKAGDAIVMDYRFDV